MHKLFNRKVRLIINIPQRLIWQITKFRYLTITDPDKMTGTCSLKQPKVDNEDIILFVTNNQTGIFYSKNLFRS